MCAGNKQCKACKKIKIGSVMKKRSKKTGTKAKSRRRRSRVSGIPMMGFVSRGAAMAGGALASKLATTLISKVIKPSNDAKKDRTKGLIVAAIKFGGGIYAATKVKDQMLKDVCFGVAAEGGLSAMPYVFADTKNPYAAGEKIKGIGNSEYVPGYYLETNMEEDSYVEGIEDYDVDNDGRVMGFDDSDEFQ